jgi:hypothetical protein
MNLADHVLFRFRMSAVAAPPLTASASWPRSIPGATARSLPIVSEKLYPEGYKGIPRVTPPGVSRYRMRACSAAMPATGTPGLPLASR